MVFSNQRRGDGHKLDYKKFHLSLKKKKYGEGGQALAQTADSPFLEILKI